MKIGIIGSGHVGGALGTRWAQGGHSVVFSSRKPDSEGMKAVVQKAGANARAGSVEDAVAASDILLLATPWPTTAEAVKSAGDLKGKVLIDAVNPLKADLSGLDLGTDTSAGERVAEWAPGAKVVKAFNTIGANIMADPKFAEHPPVLFYCGDDTDAKKQVHQLATELGFDAHDAGPLTQARLLEPFALLWISLAYAQGYTTDIAFQFLRRGTASAK